MELPHCQDEDQTFSASNHSQLLYSTHPKLQKHRMIQLQNCQFACTQETQKMDGHTFSHDKQGDLMKTLKPFFLNGIKLLSSKILKI